MAKGLRSFNCFHIGIHWNISRPPSLGLPAQRLNGVVTPLGAECGLGRQDQQLGIVSLEAVATPGPTGHTAGSIGGGCPRLDVANYVFHLLENENNDSVDTELSKTIVVARAATIMLVWVPQNMFSMYENHEYDYTEFTTTMFHIRKATPVLV